MKNQKKSHITRKSSIPGNSSMPSKKNSPATKQPLYGTGLPRTQDTVRRWYAQPAKLTVEGVLAPVLRNYN